MNTGALLPERGAGSSLTTVAARAGRLRAERAFVLRNGTVWCGRPVLLLLFGAERLPAMGRLLGSGLRGFSVISKEPEQLPRTSPIESD